MRRGSDSEASSLPSPMTMPRHAPSPRRPAAAATMCSTTPRDMALPSSQATRRCPRLRATPRRAASTHRRCPTDCAGSSRRTKPQWCREPTRLPGRGPPPTLSPRCSPRHGTRSIPTTRSVPRCTWSVPPRGAWRRRWRR